MGTGITILLVFIAVVVTLLIAVPVTRKIAVDNKIKQDAEKIGTAEEKARNIIDEALKTAETKKREALLEAKEESLRTKNEVEKETRERRAELQKYEKRVLSKEESVDKKADVLERRENEIAAKEASVRKKEKEVDGLHEKGVQELERISGFTSEEAKEYLLKSVEDEVKIDWDFVQHLPDTINSRVGERGRGFSEGQSQRLAIARAVLRDAPVLLLDEATSALDVTTERNILRNIIRQRPNKTCIVTTHRPSVLGLCQRVYRVMNGTVTELDGAEGAKMVEDF